MSRWWCVTMLAVLAGAASGCGDKACPPVAPTTSSDPAVARLVEHERTSCACQDLACASAARKDLAAWSEANEDALRAAVSDPVREMQVQVHDEAAKTCWQKLYDTATPEQRTAAGGDTDQVLVEFQALADRLCDCKDMACAEKVMQEMAAMKEPEGKPTREQMEQAMKIAEGMAECQRRLLEAEGPPPSDDESSAP